MNATADGAKLWIVIARPDRLPNALVAAQALGDRFPGGCHLLREESKWWERTNWQTFAERFAAVHAFDKVATCRGLRDLPRLYRQTTARTRAAAALPIQRDTDVVLCLASVLNLGNAVVSAHPDVYKILCVSKKAHDQLTGRGERTRFRFTTSGWLQNRVVEPLAGIERTLHYKPRLNPGGDGVRLQRLQKDPDELYDVTIMLSNSGRERPREADARLIAARFPSLAELREFSIPETSAVPQTGKRRVIFFGTPFLLVQNLSPEIYIEHLNRCLEFMRRSYPGHDFIYRPHPFETTESERLKLDGFQIENDREAAEVYFLRHFASISAVYSVSSTVSRTAMSNGLNAYSLWRCFPFPTSAANFFEKVMGDVPLEFNIRDLTKPPVAYQKSMNPDPDSLSFGEALNKAVDLRKRTGSAVRA